MATALAGCIDAPVEEPDPGPFFPSLEAFAGCPWTYPDNTSVDCDAETPALEPQAAIPLGWICTDYREEEGWSLHWDPSGEAHGLWYEAPENVSGSTGLIRLKTDETEYLYQWQDAPAQAFLPFPNTFGGNATFRFAFHDVGYATNGTLAGDARPVWSLYESQFWVVHRFDTGNGTYSFWNMTIDERPVRNADGSGTENSRVFYELVPFVEYGSDFTLWVQHDRLHLGSSLGARQTMEPNRFCQLPLGAS